MDCSIRSRMHRRFWHPNVSDVKMDVSDVKMDVSEKSQPVG